MKKQVYNPYLPSYEYIPDGEPYVFDGRLYIYGSHDKFGGDDYCQNDYVCWSAPESDLSDWRYEGIIYKKSQHPYKIGTGNLYAPDVTRGLDGKYYLYYSVAGSSIISVAVCDEPVGKYEYIGDVSYADKEVSGVRPGEFFHFDPAIFIDDDERIYLYSGFCPKVEKDSMGRLYSGAHVCELEKDMLTIKKRPEILISRDEKCPEGARFFEASSMRKINGIYYFVYSARVTGLHYYYSKYPDREFTFGGKIHSTSDVGINGHTEEEPSYQVGNTHGGIVRLNGNYYIFDHRLTNNTSYSRQGVAEQIKFDEKGRIAQVEATSCGLNNGPLMGEGIYPAYIACNLYEADKKSDKSADIVEKVCITQDGEDRDIENEHETEPAQYIKNIKNGSVAGYKYFEFKDVKRFGVKFRGHADGVLRVSVKERNEFAGNTDIEERNEFAGNTGIEERNEFKGNTHIEERNGYIGDIAIKADSTNWKWIYGVVDFPDGIHPLFLQFEGTGKLEIREFMFEKGTTFRTFPDFPAGASVSE